MHPQLFLPLREINAAFSVFMAAAFHSKMVGLVSRTKDIGRQKARTIGAHDEVSTMVCIFSF